MKIPAIKKLVEQHTLAAIQAAEEDLMEGRPLAIEVEGDDEGEQLTHILAAAWILNQMQEQGTAFMEALRAYTKRVRESIS